MKMKKWSSQWTQFMQWRKEAWKKNSGLQRGLNPWPCDIGAMLYQLSYEATDVGSRLHSQWLHSSVGRASHRYRKVTDSNPVEVLNFFSGFFTHCINCVHCHDHFFIFIITHLLLAWVQARAVTQGGRGVGNEVSTLLFKWCVMQSRTGTSALSVLLVRSKVGETDLIPDDCITPFCTCFITQPLSALLSYVAGMRVCNQAHASPVSPMYTVNGHLLHDRQ